jgi:hypothetical protein
MTYNSLQFFSLLSNIFTIWLYSMATYFQSSSFTLGCLDKINKFWKMRFKFLKSSRCLATDSRRIFLYGNSNLKKPVTHILAVKTILFFLFFASPNTIRLVISFLHYSFTTMSFSSISCLDVISLISCFFFIYLLSAYMCVSTPRSV